MARFPEGDAGNGGVPRYTLQQRQDIIHAIHDSGLPLAQRDAVLARAETRFGEARYVEKIKHFSEDGQINVGFNYADNGIKLETTKATRAFHLADEAKRVRERRRQDSE